MTQITRADILIGRPLAFDCYDERGNLLLHRGMIVTSERQAEMLVERGLFSGKEKTAEKDKAVAPKGIRIIPFEVFETCKDRVRSLFSIIKMDMGSKLPERVVFEELKCSYRSILANMAGGKPANFPEKIINVCRGIQEMCKADADAAIGAIHLDHVCRYTTIHPLHKAVLSELLSKRLNIAPSERLSIMAAALTSNISVINLQELLHGQRTPLSAAQKEMIRLHPQLSVEILSELGVTDDLWLRTVLHHHENPCGDGYPHARKGGEILLSARIVALADMYGAMIKPRAYREVLHGKDALRNIFTARCENDDKEIVHAFIKEIGIYPPGSFVRLQNGETAVVTRRGDSSNTPKVKSILDAVGMPLHYFVLRDTAMKSHAISAVIPRNKNISLNFRALWDYKLAA